MKTFLSILGVLLTLASTIYLSVAVVPASKDGNLPHPFLQKLHDFFNFKKLYIESLIKFFYVLSTMACICTGFTMLFGRTFFAGLGTMIFGPIFVRIIYEFLMFAILLVSNVISINKKLGGSDSNNNNINL